jgi:hypothetical protein
VASFRGPNGDDDGVVEDVVGEPPNSGGIVAENMSVCRRSGNVGRPSTRKRRPGSD